MDHSTLLKEIEKRQTIALKERNIDKEKVVDIIRFLQSLLYPVIYRSALFSEDILNRLERELIGQLEIALSSKDDARQKASVFLERIPDVLSYLNDDLQAIYDGDPAAKSYEEILLCYPGFTAIFIYRFAHELYALGVPVLARVMTEYAHSLTGIDINPGAHIGRYFCIDHGTGIVIGETAEIGDQIKLYQGVTIGARSFKKDANGNPVKGGKRHPTIGNNVVIYANATILGGDTVIGNDCVIGSSAWITGSVKDGEQVR